MAPNLLKVDFEERLIRFLVDLSCNLQNFRVQIDTTNKMGSEPHDLGRPEESTNRPVKVTNLPEEVRNVLEDETNLREEVTNITEELKKLKR